MFTKWYTVLITLFLFALLQINNPGFIQSLSYIYYDFLQQQKDTEYVDNVVLVNIDEKAIVIVIRKALNKAWVIYLQ